MSSFAGFEVILFVPNLRRLVELSMLDLQALQMYLDDCDAVRMDIVS